MPHSGIYPCDIFG